MGSALQAAEKELRDDFNKVVVGRIKYLLGERMSLTEKLEGIAAEIDTLTDANINTHVLVQDRNIGMLTVKKKGN